MKKTITKAAYVHRKPDGTEEINFHDSTKNNTDQLYVGLYGVMVGKVEATITYDSPEGVDECQAMISGLEEAIEKERADSKMRINLLLDRISQLQCLTHESAKS